MYKFGDIVYCDDLNFSLTQKDTKERRPCVIVCKSYNEDKIFVFPITSRINRLKYRPYQYMFVSSNIMNYKTLSLVHFSTCCEVDITKIHSMNKILIKTDKDKLIENIKYVIENTTIKNKKKKYCYLLKTIMIENKTNLMIDENISKQEKKKRKQEKKAYRYEMKHQNK